MTKKRHWGMYSKPQSTAPHSLESSGLQSNLHHEEPQSRNVNDMLANLRRMALSPGAGGSAGGGGSSSSSSLAPGAAPRMAPMPMVMPSVPPEVAHILLPSPPSGGGIGAAGPRPAGLGGPVTAAAGAHGGGAGPQMVANMGAGGARRRGPAGPAPPPSWLAQSTHAPRPQVGSRDRSSQQQLKQLDSNTSSSRRPGHAGEDMPDLVRPARGSLVDVVLQRIVGEWDTQKHYNQHYLIYLQGSLRAALVSYLGQQAEDGEGKGASIKDLRALLLHPSPPSSPAGGSPVPRRAGGSEAKGGEESDESQENELSDAEDGGLGGEEEELPSPSTLNEDFRYLDLTWSMGQSISVRELSDLLFPRTSAARSRYAGHSRPSANGGNNGNNHETDVLDSWDAPGGLASPQRPLLPNLTHLSLALAPNRSPSSVSWRQLLSFAAHLPMLTHLSLAYWPEPTLTPNAKLATVDSPLGRRFQYGGTGSYSHSLDNDWAEAVLLVRKLSKALYGLEYLDLTGCASWLPALMHNVDNGQVDWVGNWGKMTTLVLNYGVSNEYDRLSEEVLQAAQAADPPPDPRPGRSTAPQLPLGEVARRVNAASEARLIEDHIRQQRAGRGRFITVVYDREPAAPRSG
ncbi:hypothetical protein SCUCBS95973_002601 [Sporothrix curviconia]|uniref:Tafazzin n=1 Tax=Sporothrix curviconia TaxID=1260050 RepID=A0ABP0B8A8_9PEZI